MVQLCSHAHFVSSADISVVLPPSRSAPIMRKIVKLKIRNKLKSNYADEPMIIHLVEELPLRLSKHILALFSIHTCMHI